MWRWVMMRRPAASTRSGRVSLCAATKSSGGGGIVQDAERTVAVVELGHHGPDILAERTGERGHYRNG